MDSERDLAERVSRQPEWVSQTRAERLAAATDFRRQIKEPWQDDDRDAALAVTAGPYRELPSRHSGTSPMSLDLPQFPSSGGWGAGPVQHQLPLQLEAAPLPVDERGNQ